MFAHCLENRRCRVGDSRGATVVWGQVCLGRVQTARDHFGAKTQIPCGPVILLVARADLRSETFVLVKLDELDASRGFRARGTTGVADTERMKASFNR